MCQDIMKSIGQSLKRQQKLVMEVTTLIAFSYGISL